MGDDRAHPVVAGTHQRHHLFSPFLVGVVEVAPAVDDKHHITAGDADIGRMRAELGLPHLLHIQATGGEKPFALVDDPAHGGQQAGNTFGVVQSRHRGHMRKIIQHGQLRATGGNAVELHPLRPVHQRPRGDHGHHRIGMTHTGGADDERATFQHVQVADILAVLTRAILQPHRQHQARILAVVDIPRLAAQPSHQIVGGRRGT